MPNIYSLPPNSKLELLTRLGLALLFGAIIGWEREAREKPAGLRTHLLVSLGTALFVLVPIQVGAAQVSPDSLSRVIQGIIAGVGFLGAGEILRESQPGEDNRFRIRGLTSAAAIWVSAALGLCAGCGLWFLGAIAALIALIILKLFKKLE